MTRLSLLVVFVLACAAAAARLDAAPVVSFAQPQAVRLGETTEITLHGDKLEEPLSVWASFPAHLEIVRERDEAGQPKPNPDPKSLRLRVTVAEDASPGVGGIVVGNAAGVSDPVLVMLDDLPSVAESGNNHTPDDAQEIAPLTAVDGASDGAAFDYFRFPAQAGQRVAVEVVAQRLGSSFDPVVRLLDAAGRELLFVDDDPALGADCRFAHTFDHDGQYVLEVRDVQYRAGGRYRLRVGDFPLVTATFPLGAPRAAAEFRFAGPDGAAAAPVTATIPDGALGSITLAARLPGGQSSAAAPVAVSDLPNVLEVEPNDALDAAQDIALPAALNGQFAAPGDGDHYRFAAQQGEKYIFRGLARTLGSPAYLSLRLFDEKGAMLAETGAGNEVESLAFAAPADGVYRLTVEELLHGGGPGYAYRIEIEPDRPGFSLALKNDKNTPYKFLASADGGFALDVQVARQGYDGPIRLSLDAPRDGFALRQETIPAGAKEARLLVFAPPDIPNGELLAFRVQGEALEGDARATLSTAALLKTLRPESIAVPPWLDGVIHAAFGPPLEAFFGIALNEELVAFDREKKEAKFVLALERKHKDYKQDPAVFVEGLPPGATAAVKKEGKDQDERFEITVTGAEIPAGEHAFQILAFGELGARGRKEIVTAKLQVE